MKRTLKQISGWLAVALLGLSASAQAEVKPNPLFSDGAVLQRGMRVPVWGTAGDGEKVTVAFQDQKVSTTAKDGRWLVRLKPLQAGGPFTMTVTGENTVEIKNLLVGEVWVCSGQSNMEWPMSLTYQAEQALAAANDPMLRLFAVRHAIADTPQTEVSGQWQECTPQTVAGFSAVAYFFGRDLRRALNVPVGLIKTAWGGTPAEAWTSHATLENSPMLRAILENYDKAKADYALAARAYQEKLEQHKAAVEQAKQEGKEPPKAPEPPYNPENQNRPSGLYNAMIAPLIPYAIRGAIWYQGESNAGRAYEYQTLFPAMIRNWRQDWKQGDFPFLFVQLAPFMQIKNEPTESAWAELREAQRLTTLTVPRTAMAVIIDVGEENDIHPRKKEPVGARLALAARSLAYHESLVSSGPTFASLQIEGDRAILRFKNVGGGLVTRGGNLTGFTIAGEDRKFVNAEAEIRGDTVVVHSPQVPHPVAVRYGWADYPVVNLWNQEGLPASPFRTDTFPMITGPK